MTLAFHIVPVRDRLPADLDALRADAAAEGYRFLERLLAEWLSGEQSFSGDGEALLTVYSGNDLLGIGGMTREPVIDGALRMRRFYVRPSARRRGAGRLLAGALLERAQASGRLVTVNAGTADAEPFWESLGFLPDRRDGHTHILRRPSSGHSPVCSNAPRTRA